jgi:hypothetical protein
MTRIKTIVNASLICAILVLSTSEFSYGQRRGAGGRGSGVGVSRGTGVGAANGSGVGTANGSGVGTMRPPRRTAVVDGDLGNGVVGNRNIGHRPNNDLPGSIDHPVIAAAAVARRVPLGTVVEVLPLDCEMTFIYEMEYYYCSGQYYQPMGMDADQVYVAAEPYPEQYRP